MIKRSVFNTSSSAIADGPRDAVNQLRSCQLLHNYEKSHLIRTDGQTDRRTNGQNYDSQDRASIGASRGKTNGVLIVDTFKVA